ncbi:MAG: tetraacyldisaccharide 4'-kinase [Halothiobacillus sp.]
MRYPTFWQHRGVLSILLWPFSLITCRWAKSRRLKAQNRTGALATDCPVIVIGNITVGGTGKTPVLIALAQALTLRGKKVGIISRGYGAKIGVEPRDVAESLSVQMVGDEPWLIYQRLGLPVVVHPDRVRAASQLRARYPEVDVLLSDDGLQHYALVRAIELVVIDGVRGLGNQFCLPAGPLREPMSTLSKRDFVLINGAPPNLSAPMPANYWPVAFELYEICDLHDDTRYTIDEFIAQVLPACEGRAAALAAIGNPARFFDALRSLGLKLETYPLADHQPVPAELLVHLGRLAQPLLMTEKDAVKWRERKPAWHTQPGQVFAVCGHIPLSPALVDSVLALLDARSNTAS